VVLSSAQDLSALANESVDLIITSPPYPMIEMWDDDFCRANSRIRDALASGDCQKAFDLMHSGLDEIWEQFPRVVKEGGLVCINVGDATRTLNGNFQLFSSHTRIASRLISLGFQNLPNIIWRKTTNAPNKFMGSGMLPPGAYVTLEHEYILIFRKGGKRQFRDESLKRRRRESAYFWEERNQWFSDVWFDMKGAGQELNHDNLRKRSAAFPFELPYRLINMFSVKGDLVLDPFVGTGTTLFAAMASERNSIGYEIDESLRSYIHCKIPAIPSLANKVIRDRIDRHFHFVKERTQNGNPPKFSIRSLNVPCVSRQECEMILRYVSRIDHEGNDLFIVDYETVKDADNPVSELTSIRRATQKKKQHKGQSLLGLC